MWHTKRSLVPAEGKQHQAGPSEDWDSPLLWRWVNLNNLPNVACLTMGQHNTTILPRRVKGHADMFLIKFTQTAVSH